MTTGKTIALTRWTFDGKVHITKQYYFEYQGTHKATLLKWHSFNDNIKQFFYTITYNGNIKTFKDYI